MALFFKTLVKWKEPPSFRRKLLAARQKQKPKWLSPILVMLFVGFILVRVLPENFRNTEAISADKIAAICGGTLIFAIGLVFGLPLLEPKIPSWVTMTNKSILRGKHPILFKQVVSYAWLKGENHPVLQILSTKGQSRIYGIPSLNVQEKIDRIFLTYNISREENPESFQAILEKPAPKLFYAQFVCLLSLWLASFAVLIFFATVLREETGSVEQQRVTQEMAWQKFKVEIRSLDLPAEQKSALLKFKPRSVYPSMKSIKLLLIAIPSLIFLNLIIGSLLIFKFFEVKTLQAEANQARG